MTETAATDEGAKHPVCSPSFVCILNLAHSLAYEASAPILTATGCHFSVVDVKVSTVRERKPISDARYSEAVIRRA